MRTFVELLETFELRSETALAGGVDDEDDLALELGKIVNLAPLCMVSAVLVGHARDSTHTVKGLEPVESSSRRHVC